MSLSLGIGLASLESVVGDSYELTNDGLKVEGLGGKRFPNPLGLAMHHVTVSDYSARMGRPIKFVDWTQLGFEPGTLGALFGYDAEEGHDAEKWTVDMIVVDKVNKGAILPHENLFDSIVAGLQPATLEDFVKHRENNPHGSAIYGLVLDSNSLEIEHAMRRGTPSYELRKYPIAETKHVLLYMKTNPSRVPRMDEFVGSNVRAPMNMSDVAGSLRNEVTEDTGDAGSEIDFDSLTFAARMRDNDVEYVMKNNTFQYEEYATKTYVYPGPAKAKKSTQLLAKFGKIGSRHSLAGIYDEILKTDSEVTHVPVWYHKIRGHFKLFGDSFVFTNGKAVRLDGDGNLQ